MSETYEDHVKELAEAKALLERRIEQLENELRLLKLLTKLIDQALSQVSFKPASELITEKKEVTRKISEEKEIPEERIERKPKREILLMKYPIISKEGENIAEVYIYKNKIVVRPFIKFTKNASPFRSFLIERFLKRKKREDESRVVRGEILPEEAFDYEIIEDEDGCVKELIIKNYKEEELRELRNVIRWTLLRVERIK